MSDNDWGYHEGAGWSDDIPFDNDAFNFDAFDYDSIFGFTFDDNGDFDFDGNLPEQTAAYLGTTGVELNDGLRIILDPETNQWVYESSGNPYLGVTSESDDGSLWKNLDKTEKQLLAQLGIGGVSMLFAGIQRSGDKKDAKEARDDEIERRDVAAAQSRNDAKTSAAEQKQFMMEMEAIKHKNALELLAAKGSGGGGGGAAPPVKHAAWGTSTAKNYGRPTGLLATTV